MLVFGCNLMTTGSSSGRLKSDYLQENLKEHMFKCCVEKKWRNERNTRCVFFFFKVLYWLHRVSIIILFTVTHFLCFLSCCFASCFIALHLFFSRVLVKNHKRIHFFKEHGMNCNILGPKFFIYSSKIKLKNVRFKSGAWKNVNRVCQYLVVDYKWFPSHILYSENVAMSWAAPLWRAFCDELNRFSTLQSVL